MDVVPIRTVSKAVTGGVAFAVGKSLDINPRIKIAKLPVKVQTACAGLRRAAPLAYGRCVARLQVEVGASIYKEGTADAGDASGKDDVLCLHIKSVNAIVNL